MTKINDIQFFYVERILIINPMKTRKLFVLFFLMYCLIISSNKAYGESGKLLAGTAKMNITPGDRGPVHDSLYARCLVLDANGQRLAFVSIDLGGYTNDNLIKICKEKYGISQLFFCPSHTHSGAESSNKSVLENQLKSVVGLALKNMFPARISAGERTFPQLGFNRLI